MTKEFDKRNAAKSRKVCAAMAERADTGKRKLTERERQILALWPKWSNGDYCMFGDLWTAQPYGEREPKQLTKLSILSPKLLEELGQAQGENFAYEWDFLRPADTTYRPEKAERPAPKVLDADGVEIKVGDTVYEPNGQSGIVAAVHPSTRCVDLRQDGCDAYAMDTKRLTHTRPDSWKRLFADASDDACAYFGRYDENGSARCVGCPAEHAECCTGTQMDDLIRRVKALAGIEVG